MSDELQARLAAAIRKVTNSRSKPAPPPEPIVRPGELIRVRLPRTPHAELRIIQGKKVWLHVVTTNKVEVTLVGGERKLRRV